MHDSRFWLLLTLLLSGCTLASPPAPRPTPGPHSGLFVDASYEIGPISPLVYGSNTGPWQSVGLEQPAQSKAAGLSLIRWPGGNWGDENDVTPRQLDEFIALARAIGAEPLIHVRLFDGTPEQAAELVRLANIERNYAVRYWAIGNEPDLFVTKRGMDSYTVADYVRDFTAYRAAMKAVDPTILIMGPEISQYQGPTGYPSDSTGMNWMEGFLKGAGDQVDLVSVHRYPFGEPPATPATLLADPPNWSVMIDQLRSQVQRVTGKDLPLAITEANSDWTGRVDPQSGTDSQLNALWWADVLGRLIQGRTTIVAQFCLGAIPSQGIGMFGQISYDPSPRPIFEVYRLYQHFGQTLVHSSSDDSTLPILAARHSNGTLTIIVINHSASERTLPLVIEGASITGPAARWSFSTEHATMQGQDVDLNQPVRLEAHSATLLSVPVQ